jgi:hypothetical protein
MTSAEPAAGTRTGPTADNGTNQQAAKTPGRSAIFWSCLRAGVFLVAVVLSGTFGFALRPSGEPQLPVREPTVNILTTDSKFTGSVDMSLSTSGKQDQLYSLSLTITPATGGLGGTKVRVIFGSVPQPIPSLKTGSFSSPQLGTEYYESALPTTTATGAQAYSATYKSGQQIGEAASGGRLRVAFPVFTGETPGLQYSVPACGSQGSFAGPEYSRLCASLGSNRTHWYVPVLQAGQSTLKSGDPALAGYQYLSGDEPTLLGGIGWTWVGINGATVLAADVAAEDTQQDHLFYSGILLGVAASAAIALVAELLRPLLREDP